ncbi:terminase large subunit [Agrobacterium tumefaciens]|uniref:terminase large subunit n=1 Tax=Agrobacterium TaxID=357 RepID=UPI00115CEE5D|nr:MULTISPECIES: terminase TerL endonuclease subunit [Agrobacterium]MDA5240617.1 terminase large subunit [Agrobacterium sp. MAFF310724]MDA5250186.1 terminase large subunit [Agrobacterium sp. MAFF210268]TRB10130.1 terminase large subunit [Agrobacterium tumefaciens]
MIKARRPAWLFDDSEIEDPFGYGERAVDFLRRLKHPKSASGSFDLPRHWERIVRRIYGPSFPDGRRQVRTVFALLPRGARKTTLGAGLALLHTAGWERKPSGQAMVAASAEEDAAISYEEAVGIIKETDWLGENRFKLNESTFILEHKLSGAKFRALASGGKGKLGKTPQFVLADELIAWEGDRSRKTWQALRTGMNKAKGALLVIITQAGRGQENLAFDLLGYARKVQSGEVEDPSFLPILFETDPAEKSKWEGDDVEEFEDWEDERLWHFMNPGLEFGYPDIDGLRDYAREGRERPAERDAFRQYHLNTWLDYSASPFVSMPIYDEGNFRPNLDELEANQTPCYLGVDLSSTSDLTAVVAAWGDRESGYAVHPWFFLPRDNILRKAGQDGVNYAVWEEQGLITLTEGNVVDYHAVEAAIEEICARFNVREIAFDPHLARNSLNNLQDKGLPVVEFRQGWVTMSPAITELERAILARQFQHGGHPILRWHFDNIAIRTDIAGNRSFHKGKSKDRIDGAVATAMAVARCAAGETNISSYDTFEGDMDDWSYA